MKGQAGERNEEWDDFRWYEDHISQMEIGKMVEPISFKKDLVKKALEEKKPVDKLSIFFTPGNMLTSIIVLFTKRSVVSI